jgi:hypothetical protein
MLITERNVSVSTLNQTLSALLFLCREVLGVRLQWLDNVQRPTRPQRSHSDVSTTMIYTHVLKVAAGGTASPLDALSSLV